ncbi:HutP family protein [Tepidibacillus marianensis]|uniref:HutP family protein n=1 Tax=Tepidibacillus marianensis TaxID=3131995 RepID=UPI0030CBC32E
MLVNVSSSVSLAVKVAVVRDHHWIAVAMYGLSAIHPITNHHRIGLGIMHL